MGLDASSSAVDPEADPVEAVFSDAGSLALCFGVPAAHAARERIIATKSNSAVIFFKSSPVLFLFFYI